MEEALEAYTALRYGLEDEDAPVSEFAADIGLTSYDPDYIEMQFVGLGPRRQPPDTLEALFEDHSYARSFGAQSVLALAALAAPFDTLLLYGYDHQRYPQARLTPARVLYVGTFDYDRSA